MSTETLIDVAGTKMTAAQFAALAKAKGWGDPLGINPANIQEITNNSGDGGAAPSTYRVKEVSGREHEVTKTGGQYVTDNEFTDANTAKTPEGWSVWAGNVPGKRNTRVLYGYDDKGNLTGVNFEQDSSFLEQVAPLIAMAAGPLTGALAPGLAAGIGSATGLGAFGSNIAAQGLIGGGISALTGGDFLKGTITGAIGAGAVPEIASIATGLGVDKALANTLAKGLVRGASAAVSGGSFLAGASSAALEHLYGMVAAETGAPVDIVKAIGNTAGLPAALASAVSGPKTGAQATGATPAKTATAKASATGGLGSLTPAQAALLGAATNQKAQQAKPQAAPAATGTSTKGVYTGNIYGTRGYAGGGMVRKFDGAEGSYVDDPFGSGDDEVVDIPPPAETPEVPPADGDEGDFDWIPGGVGTVREVFGEDDQFERDWVSATKGSGGLMDGETLAANPSLAQRLFNGLSSAAKAAFLKPDGSLDFTKLAALGGAAYAYNRNQQQEVDLSGVGTKAGIASLTAAREQVPYQYDANRTPGSGGRRYFTDVKFADKNDPAAIAAAQQAAETQARGLAALQSTSGGVYGTLVNPIAGSSGTAGSGNVGGSSQIPATTIPGTSNGTRTPGSGYGPGGAPAGPGGAGGAGGGGGGGGSSGPLDPSKALQSIDDFEQWKLSLNKGVSPGTFNKDYEVPDWMRAAGLLLNDPGSVVGAYEFFRANPQYAADYQRIMQGGTSQFATDGSTLGKTDISGAPESVRRALSTPEALAQYEGFRMDPVLGEAVKQGLVAVPDKYIGNGTEYLRTHKWTPGGVVANDNVTSMGGQQMYGEASGAYRLGQWDSGTGDLLTPDGRRISNADYLSGKGYTGSAGPYVAPTASASNSATEVARMYQNYAAANGGDTVANRNAAIDYLQQSGLSDDVIGQAYQQYLGWNNSAGSTGPRQFETVTPVAAPTPVYTPPTVSASNSAADVAQMYAQYAAANGGDTVANRNAAIDYLQQSGASADTIGQAYQQYTGATPAPANRPSNSLFWAEGGYINGYAAGGYLDGDTNGQSDEIETTIEGSEPARLSHGEFVVPADVVAALGGGNSNAGAQTLYGMMDRIREQAYGHKQQMRPVNPNTLPA